MYSKINDLVKLSIPLHCPVFSPSTMPPPLQKKAKTASTDDTAIDFVSVVNSDSDKEGSTRSLSDTEDSEDDNISISSDIDINKIIILPNANPRIPSPPPTVEKRKRGRKPKSLKIVDEGSIIGLIFKNSSLISSFANDPVEDVPPKKLTYILSILSAEEATKTVSKRTPISMALELGEKEPWDTLKAQLLMKIDTALSPHVLSFDNYTVMFYISRVLPKPGMILEAEDSYSALLLRAANLTSKTPTINLTIQEKKHGENKENEEASGAGQKEGSKNKKVYLVMFFQRI
jgi:hypothetical protein